MVVSKKKLRNQNTKWNKFQEFKTLLRSFYIFMYTVILEIGWKYQIILVLVLVWGTNDESKKKRKVAILLTQLYRIADMIRELNIRNYSNSLYIKWKKCLKANRAKRTIQKNGKEIKKPMLEKHLYCHIKQNFYIILIMKFSFHYCNY